MSDDREPPWWLHGALCTQGLRWITPPEFMARVPCNHVIATCHSTVHCVLLGISIKFYSKSVFKRPKLGIKTERSAGEASVFFFPAALWPPIRCLWGGVFYFSYFQSLRQNAGQGRPSASSSYSCCCCCCLLRPQSCTCGSRPCVSSCCLLAEIMQGDQRGLVAEMWRTTVWPNSCCYCYSCCWVSFLRGWKGTVIWKPFYLWKKLIFPLQNKEVHVSDNNFLLCSFLFFKNTVAFCCIWCFIVTAVLSWGCWSVKSLYTTGGNN